MYHAWPPVPPQTGTFYVEPHATTATIPQKRKPEEQTDGIDCLCGFTYDDGSLSIACDECERWCHAACFDIVEGEVPEEWRCWECLPRPVNKERAARMQRERKKARPVMDPSRKKRRPSILQNHTQPSPQEDEVVDIGEPSYVPIAADIVPNRTTREKLERAAHSWRGLTALDSCKTTVTPLDNPTVRPPSYAVHTAEPIPRQKMITPYHSTIIPSSAYLADTLNAYAHLGMPKPFVHLIGPPLDLALDSRITGDNSRFVRSGCKPNAVLRPMVCPKSKPSQSAKETIGFGVFALRDLKANEEVVLGWEWDDGHVVHNLPALIESPHSFPPQHFEHLRNQMTSMLNSLSSTFTTCACGAKSNDCALNMMAAFVDGQAAPKPVDLGPLIGSSRGFRTREKVPFSGGMTGVEMVPEPPPDIRRRVFSVAELASNPVPPSVKGKERATEDHEVHRSTRKPASSRKRRVTIGSVPILDEAAPEHKMPPKMRKRWIHQSSEALRTTRSRDSTLDDIATEDEAMQVDPDSNRMPPPPIPPHRQPNSALSPFTTNNAELSPNRDISPSAHFANLTLLSPVVDTHKANHEFLLNSPNDVKEKAHSPTPLPKDLIKRHRSPTEHVKTPSPLRLLSPNVQQQESTPQETFGSPQMLLSLPHFERAREHELNGSEAPKPLSSQPPSKDQSPPPPQKDHPMQSPPHPESPPSSSDPPPDPPPTIPETPSPRPTSTPHPIPMQFPSPSPQQVSPAPQKVKTSFKDFLKRKQRQQEPSADTPRPNGVDHRDDTSEPAHMDSSPIEELRAMNVDPEPISDNLVNGDSLKLSDSWLVDPKFNPAGLLVQVKDTWHKRDVAGRLGVVKALVDREGSSPLVILKPVHGSSHDGVPVAYTIPVRPGRVGEGVVVIGGGAKGELGCVVEVGERGVGVRVGGGAGGVVEFGWESVCRVPREGEDVREEGESGSVEEPIKATVEEPVVEAHVKTSPVVSTAPAPEVHVAPPVPISPPEPVTPAVSPPQRDLPVEEGEIVQPVTPPPAAPPSTSTSGPRQPYVPSNTPTQPRSFLNLSKPTSRTTSQSLPPSRPRQLTPPSGPKALRTAAAAPKSYPQSPYPPKRSFGTNPNPPLPRGPSADRDREREWTGSSWSARSRPPGRR